MKVSTNISHKKEVSPVNKIIDEAVNKIKSGLTDLFINQSHGVRLSDLEKGVCEMVTAACVPVVQKFYEQLDEEIRQDKAGRKQTGLCVERKGDRREILTMLGTLSYERTYYRKASGGYEYPVDTLAGIEAYERVSRDVGLALVDASCRMSYAKAGYYVTGGNVSGQTVMNKIRSAYPKQAPAEYRHVPELHIDADEDHVTLQNGYKTIAPLISVYEGIDKNNKRGKCRNVLHFSEYGANPDELWEKVREEIDRRYDLRGTKIYLHGDGAAWIKTGLDYFPGSVFVLDRFHKNKAIKQLFSGIEWRAAAQYEHSVRTALGQGDTDRLRKVRDTLIARYPDRADTITEHMNYLLNNISGIMITEKDPSSLNGGCTEGHVSNVLSLRLSSRPMGWSRETLKHFLPILAAGGATFDHPEEGGKRAYPPVGDFLKTREKHYKANTLGLADPDRSVSFPARANKVTPLFNALRPF